MLHLHRQPAERMHRVPIKTQIEESKHNEPIRTTYTNDDVDIVMDELRSAIRPIREHYLARGLDIKIDDFDWGANSTKITLDLTDIAKKMNKEILDDYLNEVV